MGYRSPLLPFFLVDGFVIFIKATTYIYILILGATEKFFFLKANGKIDVLFQAKFGVLLTFYL